MVLFFDLASFKVSFFDANGEYQLRLALLISAREELPMRIVSLFPSATEMICALGLENQLVGITHECDFPASVRGLPSVTHTLIPSNAASAEIDDLVREQLRTNQPLYTLDLLTLQKLQPDLIVTQALLEWLDPPFSCGHWSPELVRLAGGIDGLGQEGQASRTLRWDEVMT